MEWVALLNWVLFLLHALKRVGDSHQDPVSREAARQCFAQAVDGCEGMRLNEDGNGGVDVEVDHPTLSSEDAKIRATVEMIWSRYNGKSSGRL